MLIVKHLNNKYDLTLEPSRLSAHKCQKVCDNSVPTKFETEYLNSVSQAMVNMIQDTSVNNGQELNDTDSENFSIISNFWKNFETEITSENFWGKNEEN